MIQEIVPQREKFIVLIRVSENDSRVVYATNNRLVAVEVAQDLAVAFGVITYVKQRS